MKRTRVAATALGLALVLGACSTGGSGAKGSQLRLTGGGSSEPRHNNTGGLGSSFFTNLGLKTTNPKKHTGTTGVAGAKPAHGHVTTPHAGTGSPGTHEPPPVQTQGSLQVNSLLSFGAGAAIRTLAIHNLSSAPVTFSAVSSASWLVVTPNQGVVTPGQSVVLTVTLDRAHAPLGQTSATITVNGGSAGPLTVAVEANVARGPSITNLISQSSGLLASPCPESRTRTQVFANVSEVNGISSVTVSWTAPGLGQPSNAPMTLGANGQYAATLGPFGPGGVIWAVSATAKDGSAAASSGQHLNVAPCPPPSISGEVSLTGGVAVRPCSTAPTTTVASVVASDPSGLALVVLSVVAPGALTPTTSLMTAGSGGSFTGTLGPFSTGGAARWWVTVTAGDGLTSTGPNRALAVIGCPLH